MLLCLVVAAGNATVAAVVTGTARTVAVTAALAVLGVATRTAAEATAIVVRSAVAGTGGSLGLIETVERNLAALVNLDNLDLHLIADVEDILDLLNATLGDAADVQETVLGGRKRDEGSKRLDGDDTTAELLTHLGLVHDELDALDGLLCR